MYRYMLYPLNMYNFYLKRQNMVLFWLSHFPLALSSFFPYFSPLLLYYHYVSIIVIWNWDVIFKVNSSTVLNFFFWPVKEELNVFFKELYTSLTYFSPCTVLVTHIKNLKQNLSFLYNINKCGIHVSLFLWWVKGNFRDKIVFRLVSVFFHLFRIVSFVYPATEF